MYLFIRPFLFSLPPETAHAATLAGLRFAHRIGLIGSVESRPSSAVELMGIRFPNRLGLAAGLDKSGTCIDALGALGFGFIEVGTVTPLRQSGNARPRLFRLKADDALINRLGFPNDGVARVCDRIRAREFKGVCGINIGKNALTPIGSAANDYIACLRVAYEHADYIAINISSPNTTELRRLQRGAQLQELLKTIVDARHKLKQSSDRHVPLLVKLTADLDDMELEDAARVTVENGIDGIIITNTTVCRNGLRSTLKQEEGGLSGAPLLRRALLAVARVRAVTRANFPIIGVGGIASVEDAAAMRAAGADLIQIYTGLIYRGPGLISEVVDAI